MKITGGKRWFVVALCALMAGIMVYVPFLRYSFYRSDVRTLYGIQACGFTGYSKQLYPVISVWPSASCPCWDIPSGESSRTVLNEKWLLIAGGVLYGRLLFLAGYCAG